MSNPPSRNREGTPGQLVLVGLPGSGKSTVGKALALRWSVAFRDTDEDIEAATGRTIGDLFIESGESHFRALERAAVSKALQEHSGVLALGGGAVMSAETRSLLAEAVVVFLAVGLSDAMQRLGMNRSRPLLLGNIRAQWQELANVRRPLYREVADLEVDTDGLPIDEIVDTIDRHWRTSA